MADTAASEGANRAIGSFSEDHWMETGKMQLDYLLRHGLKTTDHLLDIGCGNLRAGWRLIGYLDPGNYVGIDLSPEILLDAGHKVVQFDLREKRPYLYLVDGTDIEFLPDAYFDVVHAHSVFSHTPLPVFEAYVRTVARILKPNGYFDFTYIEGDVNSSFLSEDFRYSTAQLLEAAVRNGLHGEQMADWDYSQAKIRLRHPATSSPAGD
jgi:SAM-dependent methyltransferase